MTVTLTIFSICIISGVWAYYFEDIMDYIRHRDKGFKSPVTNSHKKLFGIK
jgi:low temperature requirement protein LtrA